MKITKKIPSLLLKRKFSNKFSILFLVFFLCFPLSTFAVSTPIEKVFTDIDKNYKYYDELQTFYDRGMFKPDEKGKFNPDQLLTRDEFVGIVSEVSCKKCIQPNVSYDYFSKYNTAQPFFDVPKENKYAYCIAGAENLGQIKGYYPGDVCQDGTSKTGATPFCPNNTIILEEALAIMLRTSNILSNTQADFIRSEIQSGQSFENLSTDVRPVLPSGQVYSFYPDFREALNYEITEYDTSGNQKIYKLLKKTGDKLYPKKAVSKEEFLKMAYVLLKGNSCIENNFYNVGLKIRILNQVCNEKISARCRLSNLKSRTKVFDFDGIAKLPIGDSISRKEGYVWRFYNFSTGKEIIKYGKYLDNYKFLEDGNYRVFLTVHTDKGNRGEVYNDINITDGKITTNQKTSTNLKVSIDANPLGGKKGIEINFRGIAHGRTGIISYFWEYGDGQTSYGITNKHIYDEEGTYEVTLTVTDSDGNTSSAVVLISVYNVDTDGDGISDENDRCVLTYGVSTNYGCPLIRSTDSDGDNISDDIDKCSTIPGLQKYDGCPGDEKKDTDRDGVTDDKDECPYLAGSEDNKGCPREDTDGDGIDDIDDECPRVPGPAFNKGCPVGDNSDIDGDDKSKDKDTDDDGISDEEDNCPYTPGKKENNGCPDTDDDGIPDHKDKCKEVFGVEKNNGCPIYDTPCDSDSDCPTGYYCAKGRCDVKDFVKNCGYSGGNLFYGNVTCTTCPCDNTIDFNSDFKNCDVIFPAITSPDETKLYSRGEYYRIHIKK